MKISFQNKFILLLIFSLHTTVFSQQKDELVTPEKTRGRAISLKSLQSHIKSQSGNGQVPEDLRNFAGINSILGYTVDRENRDIVIFGRVVEGLPDLCFDDFVIVLRNIFYKYAKKEQQIIQYFAPSCSIDPTPETVKKLSEIAKSIFSRSPEEELSSYIDKWNEACKTPQNVTVSGIPSNTRFASVITKADYALKTIIDGSEKLSVPGFLSHADMILRQVKSDFLQNRPLSVSQSMVDRFWLYPGDIKFTEKNRTFIIKKCSVKLLTEKQFIKETGRYSKAGQKDPIAEKFARQFSELYPSIAEKKPVFSDLENIFRISFIAKAIQYKDAFKESGLDPSFFLESYPVEAIEFVSTVPGCPYFIEMKSEPVEVKEGYKVAHFRLPSCGGVSIEMKLTNKQFIKDTTELLQKIQKEVIEQRPSTDSVSWDFELDFEEEK